VIAKIIKLLLLFLLLNVATSYGYEGFGSDATGGIKGQTILVTSPENQGPGTLRDALSQDNRYIRFSIDTPIQLSSPIKVNQLENITIDGSKLHDLVIRGYGLYFYNCKNIILANLRIRHTGIYGILLTEHTNQMVLDHCSILDASEDSIEEGKDVDITEGAHDITISWSIIGYTRIDALQVKTKGMLIANFKDDPVTNISLHHNIFFHNYQRSPQISTQGLFDVRNNLVFGWREYGMRFRAEAYGNLIANLYIPDPYKPDTAVLLTDDSGLWYASGNLGNNKLNPDKLTPLVYSVPSVTTNMASDLKKIFRNNIGALPEDLIDQEIMEKILQ